MLVISSREFRANQKSYFDRIDSGEHQNELIACCGAEIQETIIQKIKHQNTSQFWQMKQQM